MTILVDEAYAITERRTVAEAEGRVRRRYVEVYGQEEGERRLNAFFRRMASNIIDDGRHIDLDVPSSSDQPSV